MHCQGQRRWTREVDKLDEAADVLPLEVGSVGSSLGGCSWARLVACDELGFLIILGLKLPRSRADRQVCGATGDWVAHGPDLGINATDDRALAINDCRRP